VRATFCVTHWLFGIRRIPYLYCNGILFVLLFEVFFSQPGLELPELPEIFGKNDFHKLQNFEYIKD
jgi:hypothetical protein